MAGVAVDKGSMLKVARQLGEQGKPLPAEMASDPAYEKAWREGAGQPDPTKAPANQPANKAPATKTPAPTKAPARSKSSPATKPATTRPATKTSRRPGYVSRAFSPTAAANRVGVAKVASGGDAGGLLLAFVLYPIALSYLKYGAAGPGMWFRAKWLNQASTDTLATGLGSSIVSAAGAAAGAAKSGGKTSTGNKPTPTIPAPKGAQP